MTLAIRLATLRKARNLSQTDLGKKVGMTQQAIASVEDGTTLQPRKIKKLASVLGTTPEYMLYGINSAPDPLAHLDDSTRTLFVVAAGKLAARSLDPDVRENAIAALRMVAKQNVSAYDIGAPAVDIAVPRREKKDKA